MSTTQGAIVIIGCFDTKGDVFAFLREKIIQLGQKVIMINTGVMTTSASFHVDFEADVVALEGGAHIADLRSKKDRGLAMDVMGAGAAKIVRKLVEAGQVKGMVGMGGGGGTYITLAAMQNVPFGIPKLCLSTVASKDLSRQIGHKDITLMPSVVDVAGLNGVIQVLIEQAAAAVCAMANITRNANSHHKKSIAISMFGNTTACVNRCTKRLEELGYEVLAFHANGVGGSTMEALIHEGVFDAVLDVTTTELADDICDGICSAGPHRLTAATEMGIPQVVVPGCLDMVNFAHPDTVPARFKDRKFYSWAPDVTLMRTNAEENEILGKRITQSLNRSAGPAVVVLPLQGISQVDAEGGIFYDAETDQVLFSAIKQSASEHVKVLEQDAHINSPEFADFLVDTLLDILPQNHQS